MHILVPIYLFSAIVPLGSGSYTTDLPAGGNPPLLGNGAIAYPAVTTNITGPIPTNDWWTSLVYKNNVGNNFSEVLAAHPFMLKCTAQGLGIGSTSNPTGNYSYPYTEDLTVRVANTNFEEALLDGYGDWTVKAKWESGSNSLCATFGHGLAYLYFTKTGGNASLDFVASPTVWYNSGGVLGLTINGNHYGIFAPSGSTWSISGDIVESNLAGNDFFSIAVLPDSNVMTVTYFEEHAYAFITDSQVSWSYNEETALLTSTYQVTTEVKEGNENQALLAQYRHQWLNSNEVFTSYSYPSPRGEMKLFAGNTFNTEMVHMGILPAFSNELSGSSGYNQSQLEGYIQELANQSIDQLIPWGDTYFHGKDLGKIAQVVSIADQVGNTTARDYFISCLKSRIENWLTASMGESSPLYYYNNTWGTIAGFPASFAADSQLNDHHFHWGYFIMAAAKIAQYDASWASQSNWGGMVELLIRDAAAWDRNDTLFPFLRSFDIYAGHGWAGGHGATSDGNNQESSSESMNFSAAVALWGSITGNDDIRDLGIYLYTNETQAIEQYWFDVDNEVFPDWFGHNCLGIVWGTGGVHSTWFSGQPEMIHGINYLPLTSASLYLGRNSDYVMDNYNELVAENGGPEDVWHDIIWEYLALSNPQQALSKFNSNPTYSVEGGETRAHTYYWLHSMNSMGQVDVTVTADVPNYTVFINNGVRTYMAYNPSLIPITVTFSDGASLDVPARQIASSYSEEIVESPVNPIDFEENGYGADWAWEVFENASNPVLEVVSNPLVSGLNSSNMVAKFTALQAGPAWAGCSTSHGQDIGEFTFDEENYMVRLMVYKSVISDVGVKFHANDGSSSGEITVANTLINQWEELVFDFSSKIGETNDQLVIFPDFNQEGREQDNIVYFDNIRFSGPISYDSPPNALIPDHDEEINSVICIYSDSYTNVSTVDYNPNWGQSTIVTTDNIGGNELLKYTNLNFQGTDWNSNPQDLSELEYLHVDFWTASSTELGIFLISGLYPNHTEIEYELDIIEQEWNSVEIPLSYFSENGVDISDARQFKISGNGTVWFDNIYFYGQESTPTQPYIAAPIPEVLAENVISIFSDSYWDRRVNSWSAAWDQADVEDVQIAGNNTKLYTNLNYAGIEFTTHVIDASAMTHFHIDIWTPNDTSDPNEFKLKLVDFGMDGNYGGGDDSEHEISFDHLSMTTGTWVSLDIPMSEFSSLSSTGHLAQLLISGDLNTVYVDNIYFYSQISELDVVDNVSINIVGENIYLSWEAVNNANSYSIYSAIDPTINSENWTLEAESITATNYSQLISNQRRFYYVIASTNARSSLSKIRK
jgi:endoglucanase Acf2